MLSAVHVQIVRFTCPDFPGWVECLLRDTEEREWTLADKAPVFTDVSLDAASIYPQPGFVTCEIIVQQWTDDHGRTRCIIDTAHPWGVSTKNGETRFEVFIEQITFAK
jgi:hypothetical protein